MYCDALVVCMSLQKIDVGIGKTTIVGEDIKELLVRKSLHSMQDRSIRRIY